MGRDYQQNDPAAVESEDFDRVRRLESVSVESYRSSAGGKFGRCTRPIVELVQHAINGPESYREHRKQIWKLCGQVIIVRPPRPIDIPGVGRLGLQPQPRRVFRR